MVSGVATAAMTAFTKKLQKVDLMVKKLSYQMREGFRNDSE
jgi:hypothetical protein